MNKHEWRKLLNDRSMRYAGRVLDSDQSILLSIDETYASGYDGQVALITAASLFSRMSPSVFIDAPTVPVVPELPWRGIDIKDAVMQIMKHADPYAPFDCRAEMPGDYIVRLASKGRGRIVHGSGWNIFIGHDNSPIVSSIDLNPIGPAMAVIIEASNIFHYAFNVPRVDHLYNALYWSKGLLTERNAFLPRHDHLGRIWTIGTGSVGTSVLYFLAQSSMGMDLTLFDMDEVEVENIDRSPIFGCDNVGSYKVHATASFLEKLGISNIAPIRGALNETEVFTKRDQGVPDILISAANEFNVRSIIESNFPPIQIYGTTGNNWQASMIRHIPFVDPCSCCLFPENIHADTVCATTKVETVKGEQVDTSLPFLSFAAGAMAAAEILKTCLPGYPFTANRTFLYAQGRPRFAHANLSDRAKCICRERSKSVHRQMLLGSKHAGLSAI